MFTVTHVGSWPRSPALLRALRELQRGRITRRQFDGAADDEVRRCVSAQLEAGVEVVGDGEQRRDSFYSFVADRLDGCRMMSLAELLDTVEDKSGFEELLTTLDVPASAIKNPTCVGKLRRREALAVDELRFVQQLTDRPAKVTLPGPYLLTRSMWVAPLSGGAYADKTEMGDDVVRVLREELSDLRDAGCHMVQFDEPVLTEVVMSEECHRRTFM